MSAAKIDKTDEQIRRISFSDDEDAFRMLFYDFFSPLCVFAYRYVEDQATCEDLVQDTFFRIWKNRKSLDIHVSARSFMLTAVRNNCLDWLRKQAVEKRWEEKFREEPQEETSDLYTTVELEYLLNQALDKLPEQISSTFRSNRFEGKTYPEIAAEKNISVKTVEAYMSKALKLLRVELRDYLAFFIGFL